MNDQDLLVEFDKPVTEPKIYRYVILMAITVLCTVGFVSYNNTRSRYAWEPGFSWFDVYNYAFLFLYPVIGLVGFMLLKKYGWFILGHYFLSSSVLMIVVCLSQISRYRVADRASLLMVVFTAVNVLTAYFLFKKKMLQHFNINRQDILSFILLLVVFTISYFMMLFYH